MNFNFWVPLLAVFTSLVPGVWIFFLREESVRLRTGLNIAGNVAKLLLILYMMHRVYAGRGADLEFRMPLFGEYDLLLRADSLSMMLVSLSAVLWLLTTIYAVFYLEVSPHRSRFFGFFSLCISATIGLALSGNLLTFLIFYELLTLTTYPLVVHRGTETAVRAGRIYLAYTLGGGAVLLVGIVWLHAVVGPFEFGQDLYVARRGIQDHGALVAIFALLIFGLGVKAALIPLHVWLPVAMVAPAPVSALLHAVAVVKAGAFGIVRVVYDVYGITFCRELGIDIPLAALASATIVYGSVRALFQDDLKRRLAFSTVSQVSYITLGVAIAGPSATVGGLVHLVHQGLMKITLFFCAGNIAETLGRHRVSELAGVGRRMPITMAAFTIGAFGMMGVPPLAGFISKWHLGVGGLEAGQPWVLAVLAISTLLNAAYFLPVIYTAWFGRPESESAREMAAAARSGKLECPWGLLLPPVVTAALTLAAGLFAASALSPLHWAVLTAARAYLLEP